MKRSTLGRYDAYGAAAALTGALLLHLARRLRKTGRP